MCFSAEADAIAALVIGAVGMDALRHVAAPRQLQLAVLPMVFAAHQLIESLVWWWLEGKVPATVGELAEWLYLVIAFGVLPVLVPVAVGAVEPVTRRPLMGVFVCVGAVVSADLMFAVVRGPITATIEGHYIAYEVDLWHGGGLVVLYVLATCGSVAALRAPARPRLRRDQPHRGPSARVAESSRLHLRVVCLGRDHQRGHRRAPQAPDPRTPDEGTRPRHRWRLSSWRIRGEIHPATDRKSPGSRTLCPEHLDREGLS